MVTVLSFWTARGAQWRRSWLGHKVHETKAKEWDLYCRVGWKEKETALVERSNETFLPFIAVKVPEKGCFSSFGVAAILLIVRSCMEQLSCFEEQIAPQVAIKPQHVGIFLISKSVSFCNEIGTINGAICERCLFAVLDLEMIENIFIICFISFLPPIAPTKCYVYLVALLSFYFFDNHEITFHFRPSQAS